MPVLFGFILGVVVTIVGAYAYDAQTGRSANGLSASAAGGAAPMVNWSVVSEDWNSFANDVRSTTEDLKQKLKQHAG